MFNFITYGGHQIDGVAAEEFATALLQDGMLALAQLQRKIRLLESPYRTPQTLVGGPRLDAALAASSARTATTKAMGKGSTQVQHLKQTELPKKVLEDWLATWTETNGIDEQLGSGCDRAAKAPTCSSSTSSARTARSAPTSSSRPSTTARAAGSSRSATRTRLTPAAPKRLMTLIHLYLFSRYKVDSVHYVAPTDDNAAQCERMKSLGIYTTVSNEVGAIIVAEVDQTAVRAFTESEAITELTRGQKAAGSATQ